MFTYHRSGSGARNTKKKERCNPLHAFLSFLPVEPAFHSRDANNSPPTTPTDWSLGCHFRRVCRGGSGHVFSSALLRISVVPHKFVSDFRPGGRGSGCHFRPAVGTRRGYVKESGFTKDFSCTAQICLGFSRGGWGSGCYFRPALGTRLGYVKESGFIKDSLRVAR